VSRLRTVELVQVNEAYDWRTGNDVGMRLGDASSGGLSPMDTLLVALAACTAMDVNAIATKKRQRIDRYVIRVVADQRDDHPRIYGRIDITHELEGRDLSEVAIRRSIELSATKYCPVSAMLSAGPTEIHHGYRIRVTAPDPWEATGEAAVTGPHSPVDPAPAG
jgi:putative redox protein